MNFKPGDKVIRTGAVIGAIRAVQQGDTYTVYECIADELISLEGVNSHYLYSADNFELDVLYDSPLRQALR